LDACGAFSYFFRHLSSNFAEKGMYMRRTSYVLEKNVFRVSKKKKLRLDSDPGVTWLNKIMALRLLQSKPAQLSGAAALVLLETAELVQQGSKRNRLIKTLKSFAQKYGLDDQDLFEEPMSPRKFEWLLESEDGKLQSLITTILQETLTKQLQKLSPDGAPPESPFLKRLVELCETFKLSELEHEILAVCALSTCSMLFQALVDKLNENYRRGYSRTVAGWQSIEKLADFISASLPVITGALSEDSKLRRLGFIDSEYKPSHDVFQYLMSLREDPLSERYFKSFTGETLPLDRLMIKPSDINTIRAILKNRQSGQGVNLLLGGPPGVGKTETVRSLAAYLGLQLYEVRSQQNTDNPHASNDEGTFRIRALWAAQNLIGSSNNTVILIDEADDLLGNRSAGNFFGFLLGKRSSVGKAVLNEALDRSNCIQFWVANNLAGIDSSTRRRFDYAIKYEKATAVDRQSIWLTATERYGLTEVISIEEQRKMACRFQIDAGGIDSALRNTANLQKAGLNKEQILGHIEQLLASQQHFMSGNPVAFCNNSANEEVVAPENLNIKPVENLNAMLQIIEKAKGKDQSQEKLPSLRLLFCGFPGTGKTHLARSIADDIGCPLHYKTASSILDKYVGEAEKNIREAFYEAQRENAILFFDEIDSLLRSRESASQRWEVSQVNEFLSALESFQGIFIAATNHVEGLDKASLRRFHFCLNFEPLSSEGSLNFYRTLLLPLADGNFGSDEINTLAAIQGLTPSDFGSLKERLKLIGDSMSHSELIEALKNIRDTRLGGSKPAIGFKNAGQVDSKDKNKHGS